MSHKQGPVIYGLSMYIGARFPQVYMGSSPRPWRQPGTSNRRDDRGVGPRQPPLLFQWPMSRLPFGTLPNFWLARRLRELLACPPRYGRAAQHTLFGRNHLDFVRHAR